MMLETYAREARSGEATAQEMFAVVGHALGVAAANHINVLDPARLVVLVEHEAFAELIAEPFNASVAANTLPALQGRVPIEMRVIQEHAFAKGAAALVLERLYLGART